MFVEVLKQLVCTNPFQRKKTSGAHVNRGFSLQRDTLFDPQDDTPDPTP